MTSTASMDWPRAYLFQIHAEAVANGLVFIEPISEVDAKSLRQRLYRTRRRSDKANAVFIPPEYHLVTVGKWEATPEGGRLPIIYDRLPDGKPLPTIRAATPDEATRTVPLSPLPEPAPLNQTPTLDPEQLLANTANLTLEPDEVEGFVADLIERSIAAEKKNAGE